MKLREEIGDKVGIARVLNNIAYIKYSNKDTLEALQFFQRSLKLREEIDDKIGIRVCAEARKNGVIIRPLGNVVVLMPPLTISAHELNSLTRITGEAIGTVTG